MSLSLLSAEFTVPKTVAVLVGILVLVGLDLTARTKSRGSRYALGVLLGTVLAIGLIQAVHAIFAVEMPKQGTAMALGVFLIVVAWRFLFGNWEASTKATVLGTFILWVALHMLMRETPEQRFAHVIAIGVAAIPAAVWCAMFLPYHRERPGVVLTMVFAGMLSTVPVLFYDSLVRSGAQLNFFLLRIVPESFNRSAALFVSGGWPGVSPLQSSLMSMFLSFLLVGIIEEGSKYWVLKRAGSAYATSIDDVMQLAVLTAIGFAFAENVINTGYFVAFVREYLLDPESRSIVNFVGNVAGRSVLTSMVHIVSTGVMGYYLGLAMYAGPLLQEKQNRGVRSWIIEELHALFGIPRKDLYRRLKILTGFVLAVSLHALSNFLVSLPDALPGNPRTLGDLLHAGPGSPFNLLALLLVPTLLYVVGGFSLLTALFDRKENMKERGHVIPGESFVTQDIER